MKSISESFTKNYLNKLDNMNISIKTVMDNFYIGNRKSNKKGNSLEFSDFKEYIPGDDIRRIDWNSYARTDRIYVKRFDEEREAGINIFIDASTSMDYGNENKGYYSKILSASLAYIALKSSDNVNIFVCGDELKQSKLNLRSKRFFSDTVEFLDNIRFEGNTSLSRAILQTKDIRLNKGISFIISDFFSEDGFEDGIKSLYYRKQKIAVLHIVSPQEANPALNGNIRFIDSESGLTEEVNLDETVLKNYKKQFEIFSNTIKEAAYKTEGAYKRIVTDMPVIENFITEF